MAKRKITVVKAFTLTHDDGSTQAFGIGDHSVHPKVAGHWYVKAHTNGSSFDEDAELKAENEEKAESEAAAGEVTSAKSTG